jgi:NAD(P)-dependent dehydrogenase (short-subunit alcohol dehydrogenase family)
MGGSSSSDGQVELVAGGCAHLHTGVTVVGLHPGLAWPPMTSALAREKDKSRWLPYFARRSREDFVTSEPAAAMLACIAARDADRLSGLLSGVDDKLDLLREQAAGLRAEQRRTLRAQ